METDLAYDDVPMQWTKDAKEAIRAVPAGFQRRRAKAKIEKSARKLGMTTITLEYAAPMIKEAASEDYHTDLCQQGCGHFSQRRKPETGRRFKEIGTQGPPRRPADRPRGASPYTLDGGSSSQA